MQPKLIRNDLAKVCLLWLICLIEGFVTNKTRVRPQPLIYYPREPLVSQEVEAIKETVTSSEGLNRQNPQYDEITNQLPVQLREPKVTSLSGPTENSKNAIQEVQPSTLIDSGSPVPALEKDVDRVEMDKISSNHLALILDVRPKTLFRMGHIPSALSLPLDDFENSYKGLQKKLEYHRNKPLVIYCFSLSCPDSQTVAEALQKLGYQRIRLFRGGWSEWVNAKMPSESE